MPDTSFEKLQTLGSYGLQVNIGFAELAIEYGDGYSSGLLLGTTEGTKNWRLVHKSIIDTTELTFDAGELYGEQTYFRYVVDFFKRHKAAGNKPFYLTCPEDGLDYLAKFGERQISLEAVTYKVWSTGLLLLQARLKGFRMGADGIYAPNPQQI